MSMTPQIVEVNGNPPIPLGQSMADDITKLLPSLGYCVGAETGRDMSENSVWRFSLHIGLKTLSGQLRVCADEMRLCFISKRQWITRETFLFLRYYYSYSRTFALCDIDILVHIIQIKTSLARQRTNKSIDACESIPRIQLIDHRMAWHTLK